MKRQIATAIKRKQGKLPREKESPMICSPALMKQAIRAAQEDKRRIRADPERFLASRRMVTE